jgi:hypothetical protein
VDDPSPSALLGGPEPDVAALFSVDGLVAVVTGASSGLGMRFAQVLHAAGARVVVSARRADRLERLVDLLPGITAVPGDVCRSADREQLIEAAVATHGRVDVLVNNAGIGSPEPAETETVERFEEVLDVNVTALFALSQLAGRVMLEQRSGSIINLASILGLVASAPIKQASYTASKGAVVKR